MALSPELELLDQLEGGNLSLSLARQIVGDDSQFYVAVKAMLHDGQVVLLAKGGGSVPLWKVSAVLGAAVLPETYELSITPLGLKMIG